VNVLILKVDFEKAYVDCGFLEYMMRRVGLSPKWTTWMKACVFGRSIKEGSFYGTLTNFSVPVFLFYKIYKLTIIFMK